MRAEIKGDEKQLIDLEWPNSSQRCTMMPHASTTIDTLDKVSMAQLRLRLGQTLQYSTSFAQQYTIVLY